MMDVKPQRRRVDRVFLHCSASELDLEGEALVAEIIRWHLARGFSTIGYQFVIDKQGAVLAGRDLEKIPAAQKGHNKGSLAICVHGLDFDANWAFSPQGLATVELCEQINDAYDGLIAFWAHNEVANKSCPVFDHKALLRLDRWRRMP